MTLHVIQRHSSNNMNILNNIYSCRTINSLFFYGFNCGILCVDCQLNTFQNFAVTLKLLLLLKINVTFEPVETEKPRDKYLLPDTLDLASPNSPFISIYCIIYYINIKKKVGQYNLCGYNGRMRRNNI